MTTAEKNRQCVLIHAILTDCEFCSLVNPKNNTEEYRKQFLRKELRRVKKSDTYVISVIRKAISGKRFTTKIFIDTFLTNVDIFNSKEKSKLES